MTQTVARDRFSPSLSLSLSRRVTSHHVNAAVTQFQRPLPPRRAPLPSFPLFPVFIRSLCFNLSVPLSLFLQLLKKKVCNCFFLFFWRGHGCNLASFFFCFFPQGGYLSHYFCRMEAKLPRTWCNPLRVTTSTGSSLCPTVLQTAFHPPHLFASRHSYSSSSSSSTRCRFLSPHGFYICLEGSTTGSRVQLFWSQVRPEICQSVSGD